MSDLVRATKPLSGLMIVRRGMSPAFHFFCGVFAREHGFEVVPDRRQRDRRDRPVPTSIFDKRRSDRRVINQSFGKQDFIVVRIN
ncbi:MAG TPA: hypothetical protein VM939_15185 [Gemmatimonadaceae bacterium]|nr:hypothetical protein [Gemmatimonadaceae bacterium]